jgi:hypothetical protein
MLWFGPAPLVLVDLCELALSGKDRSTIGGYPFETSYHFAFFTVRFDTCNSWRDSCIR